MATAKQYELLFMLKAQVESAFSSGFSTAKTYIGELQSKVKEYNQALRDISAYEKHKAALDTLKSKYKAEEQLLEQTKAKITENGSATKELTAEKEKHEKELSRLAVQIDKSTQKLQADTEQLEKAGISTNELTQKQAELENQLQETIAEMEGFKQFENTINDVASAFGVMKIGADMASNAIITIDSGIMSCINSAAELQYTMSGVQAVSGATSEETQQLTSLAKEMGATTVYTASQCAEAMQTQALAGWSVQEMLAGLPAVVKLAAASGEDLTEMTGIVSDALNAFGLQGEAAVTKFADVLTKAATSSNTNVSLIGESLSYVESTAANLGYSIEDVSVALAQMANNALKGSVSGSALNTMLTRMSGANENAAAEMDNLGLSMYNADGSAKDLMTFLNELRTAFQGFGDDANAAQVAAYNLAGQRGMRGLLSIVNASDTEWQQLTQDIYDYEGAANSVSDIRLNNYTGQVYLLTSAWDALKTTVGELFLPAATKAAGVLTDLIEKANGLVQEHQALIPILAGAANGFLAVSAAISVVATGAQIAKYALATMSIELLPILGMAGAVGIFAAGIGALAGAFVYASSVTEAESEAIRELKTETDALADTAQSDVEAWNSTAEAFDDSSAKAYRLIDMLDELQSQNQSSVETQRMTEAAVKSLNEQLPNLNLEYDKLTGNLSMSTDQMRSFADAVSDVSVDDIYEQLANLEAGRAQAEAMMESAQALLDEAIIEQEGELKSVDELSAMGADVGEAYTAFQNAKQAFDEYSAAVEEAKQKTDEFEQSERALAEAGQLTETQTNEITEAAQAYQAAWTEAYDSAYEKFSQQISLYKEADEVTRISTEQLNSNLDSQLEQWTTYQQNLQTILDSGVDVSSMWGELANGSADAKATVQEFAEQIKAGNVEAVETTVGKYNELQQTISETASTASDNTQKVKDALQDVTDTMNNAGPELHDKAVEVAKQAISGLGAGLQDEDGVIQQSAGQLTNHMITQLKQAAGESSALSKQAKEVGKSAGQGVINGLAAKEEDLTKKSETVAKETTGTFSNNMKPETFKTYGIDSMQGAINGINDKKGDLISAARTAGQEAAQAYKAASQINSPSKLFRYFGEMQMEGAALGVKKSSEENKAVYAQAAQESAAAYQIAQEHAVQDNMTVDSGIVAMVDPRAMELLRSTQREKTSRRTLPVIPTVEEYTNNTSTAESKSTVIQLEYKPVIHVEGDVSAETVNSIRQQLIEHDGELYDALERFLDEREDANRRRAY